MTGYRVFCSALSAVLVMGCGGSGAGAGEKMSASIVMDDTTAFYDIWLTVRTPSRTAADSLTLMMDITAPEGIARSADTVVIPMNRDLISSGSFEGIRSVSSVLSYDLEVLYRTGVQPRWPGEWKFSFMAEPPVVEEIWAEAEKKRD